MATFTLDICEGKDRAQLCKDYRRASRTAFHWQNIALRIADLAPEAVEKLPPQYRDEVKNLLEAYKD